MREQLFSLKSIKKMSKTRSTKNFHFLALNQSKSSKLKQIYKAAIKSTKQSFKPTKHGLTPTKPKTIVGSSKVFLKTLSTGKSRLKFKLCGLNLDFYFS